MLNTDFGISYKDADGLKSRGIISAYEVKITADGF